MSRSDYWAERRLREHPLPEREPFTTVPTPLGPVGRDAQVFENHLGRFVVFVPESKP